MSGSCWSQGAKRQIGQQCDSRSPDWLQLAAKRHLRCADRGAARGGNCAGFYRRLCDAESLPHCLGFWMWCCAGGVGSAADLRTPLASLRSGCREYVEQPLGGALFAAIVGSALMNFAGSTHYGVSRCPSRTSLSVLRALGRELRFGLLAGVAKKVPWFPR